MFERAKALQILLTLDDKKPMSFNELQKVVGGSPRTLIDRLDELSAQNIVYVGTNKKFPFRNEIILMNEGKRIKKLLKNIEG